MTKKELYELLEIDTPEDFQYFEQFADLVEGPDEPDEEDLAELLKGAPAQDLAEISTNYFEELTKAIPEDQTELSLLADSVAQRLSLLLQGGSDADAADYAAELLKFRKWYQSPEGASVDGEKCSVMEAMASLRAEKIGEAEHEYDFPGALEYELDEIVMPLGKFEKIDVVQ